jgi:hypothetical protein
MLPSIIASSPGKGDDIANWLNIDIDMQKTRIEKHDTVSIFLILT